MTEVTLDQNIAEYTKKFNNVMEKITSDLKHNKQIYLHTLISPFATCNTSQILETLRKYNKNGKLKDLSRACFSMKYTGRGEPYMFVYALFGLLKYAAMTDEYKDSVKEILSRQLIEWLIEYYTHAEICEFSTILELMKKYEIDLTPSLKKGILTVTKSMLGNEPFYIVNYRHIIALTDFFPQSVSAEDWIIALHDAMEQKMYFTDLKESFKKEIHNSELFNLFDEFINETAKYNVSAIMDEHIIAVIALCLERCPSATSPGKSLQSIYAEYHTKKETLLHSVTNIFSPAQKAIDNFFAGLEQILSSIPEEKPKPAEPAPTIEIRNPFAFIAEKSKDDAPAPMELLSLSFD